MAGKSNRGKNRGRASKDNSKVVADANGVQQFNLEKHDGGIRSKEEEKVYSWLHTLAQTERNLVFEYVRSTERGLSFSEVDTRLREVGQIAPHDQTFRSWWQILWNAVLHPFIVILIVLSALSYLTGDDGNGIIILILVFITVSLRFYQEFNSSKAAMKLSELLKSPVKV